VVGAIGDGSAAPSRLKVASTSGRKASRPMRPRLRRRSRRHPSRRPSR
jgi:hypothetical protein